MSSGAALQDLQATTAAALWDPVQLLQLVFTHQADASVHSKLLCVSKQFQAVRPAQQSLSVLITTSSMDKAYGSTVAEKAGHITAWMAKVLERGLVRDVHVNIDWGYDNCNGLLSTQLSKLLADMAANPGQQQFLPQLVTWCAHHHRLQDNPSALSTTLSHLERLNVHCLTLNGVEGDVGIRNDSVLQQIATLTGLQNLTLGVQKCSDIDVAAASQDLLKLLPFLAGLKALTSLQIGTVTETAYGTGYLAQHPSSGIAHNVATVSGRTRLLVLPRPDDEPWRQPHIIARVSPLVFKPNCAANLQRLEVPDLILTSGSVLPVGLTVLTVKRILPEAVGVLAPLTGLQQLQLARVPNAVIEATVKALLPVLRGLASLKDLTVHPSERLDRGSDWCLDGELHIPRVQHLCRWGWDNGFPQPWEALTLQALNAWSALRHGLADVRVHLGRPDPVSDCRWRQTKMFVANASHGPVSSRRLQLLPAVPCEISLLWIEDCDMSDITPTELADIIIMLPKLRAVLLSGVRLRSSVLKRSNGACLCARGEELVPLAHALGSLPQLEFLSLSDCLLTDDFTVSLMVALGAANRLRGLQLARTKDSVSPRLSDAVMFAISRHLADLTTLDVRHHCITPHGVRQLERLAQLQELAVTGSARVQEAVMDVCPGNFAGSGWEVCRQCWVV